MTTACLSFPQIPTSPFLGWLMRTQKTELGPFDWELILVLTTNLMACSTVLKLREDEFGRSDK